MTAERWVRVQELFSQALDCEPGGRAALLDRECRGDERLRGEVDSLLASEQHAHAGIESIVNEGMRSCAVPPSADVQQVDPSLPAGTWLGVFEIISPIGTGGMGEVYRARDTLLNREVAVKVLPKALAGDSARMARFEREAQLLAAINHPNIAAIFGVEQGALIMELVEGEDLHGPLPVKIAVAVARQIAEGLEAAHEKGIVHRDLKPANIRVNPDGVVKLLDFGLAKAGEQPAAAAGTGGVSPSPGPATTHSGMILGTPAYMAPEQARGKPVDKRADIWAFGVVLYELLTGQQPFAVGETIADTIAAVVTREPDWTALPPDTPANIRRLLERCLCKDPRVRLRDIGEARILIDEPVATQAERVERRRPRLAWALFAAVSVLAVSAGWVIWRMSRPVSGALMRLSVDLGPDAVAGVLTTAAISPDGRRIVFLARGPDGKEQLATRLLDHPKASLLAATERATDPFFSPDGEWIGYFADRKLKKISVQGGAPVTLCEADEGARGASWADNGNIIAALSRESGISRVPAEGGAPQIVTHSPRGTSHRWPQVLAGGKAVLFTSKMADETEVDALSFTTGQVKTVQRDAYFGRYVPSGHLVYMRGAVLFGVRFDPVRLETVGSPIALLEDLAANEASGAGRFAFSSTGTFLYASGKLQDPMTYPVLWLDRSGKTEALLPTPGLYYTPRLSPDGSLLAISAGPSRTPDVYVWDTQRETLMRLTFNARRNVHPVWTPDGKHIVYQSFTNGVYTIWWIRADGGGEARKLLESKGRLTPASFSPDGRRLAYRQDCPETGSDLFTLPIDTSEPENPKPGRPDPFLVAAGDQGYPMFSPDGRWLAYASNESGHFEVYVRPFPGPGGRWQISAGGGSYPMWSHAASQIFFEIPDYRIMVADYAVNGGSFVAGQVRPWNDSRIATNLFTGSYDIAPDGKRVAALLNDREQPKGSLHLTFLLNFFDELRRRLPAPGNWP